MVFGWYIKQIVKKKFSTTSKDKKDWISFIKKSEKIYDKDKDSDFTSQYINQNITKKLDLHGNSLDEANKKVKKFIIKSFEEGHKKLLIVTGKGLRSKVYNDIYRSKKMSVLKHSVPEYIKHDEDLLHRIDKIENASLKDGGEGAIYIYLKNL